MSAGTAGRLGLLALIWGSSFLLIEVALQGLSPVQITLVRLTAGAGVLCVVLLVRRTSLPDRATVWAHLALMSLFSNIVPFTLFGWAQERITSGMAAVFNGMTPLLTVALAAAFVSGERLDRARVGGLVLGFGGVAVLVAPWEQGPLGGSILGQLACLLAPACYAGGFVYTRRNLAGRGYPPLALAAAQCTLGSAMLWVAAPFVAAQQVTVTPVVGASVLALGGVGTGLAFILYFRLVMDAGATTASLVTYLIPVVAVTLGVVVLSEPVSWNLFAGAAVIIAGVAVAEGRLPALPCRALPTPESGAPPPVTGDAWVAGDRPGATVADEPCPDSGVMGPASEDGRDLAPEPPPNEDREP